MRWLFLIAALAAAVADAATTTSSTTLPPTTGPRILRQIVHYDCAALMPVAMPADWPNTQSCTPTTVLQMP